MPVVHDSTQATAPRPSPSRRPRAGRSGWLPGAAGLLVLAVAWEASARLGLIDESTFPPLGEVLPRLFEELGQGEIWLATGDTLQSAGLGLLISTGLALPAGILIGANPIAFRSTKAVIEFLKPIPVVTILPLALLMYGAGMQMKVTLIVFGTFWPLLMQVVYGVQNVDPVLADTARCYRLRGWRRWALLVLPSAAPFIATGLRLAAVSALILSVVTELVGGAPGLGRQLVLAQNGAAFDLLYALVLFTGVLGLAMSVGTEILERRVIRWRPQGSEAR